MPKYIHAGDFARRICNFEAIDEHSANAVISLLYAQPTADVVEVKHGHWKHTVKEWNMFTHHFYNCSICGASAFTSGYEKHCHECGAIMDGGKAE